MALIAPVPKSFKIVCASNNIPTTPDATAGSLCFSGLMSNPANKAIPYSHIEIINETAGRIKVFFVDQNGAVPSLSNTQSIFVPATSIVFLDGVSILDSVYVASDTGSAIALATVELNIW